MDTLYVSATELKRQTGELLDRVKYGNTRLIITKANVEYAVIVKISPPEKADLSVYKGMFTNLSSHSTRLRHKLNNSLNSRISGI